MPSTSSAQLVIKDFQGFGPVHSFDFDYLSWTGQITNTATGIEVGGTPSTADTFGGAGGGVTFDLTGYTDLAVSAKLLPGNAATAFNVVLQSAPGVSSVYQFSTTGLSSGYQSVSVSLASPFLINGGGANLATITEYQIQGNFEGPVALGLGFATVTAVPEPTTWALLLGGAAFLTLLHRRKIG
jgi:hypothetical protein